MTQAGLLKTKIFYIYMYLENEGGGSLAKYGLFIYTKLQGDNDIPL